MITGNKCAVLTISGNEPDFLKMWYAYYSQHFDDDHIYILDNESQEQYTPESLGVGGKVERIGTGEGYNGDSYIRICLNRAFVLLLPRYEYVLAHDVDMLVVPDPVKYPGGLTEYIEKFSGVFAQCSGYDVHGVDCDPLDIEKPLLAQRKTWHRDWEHLCKVVLACEDPVWGGGCHESLWTFGGNPNGCLKPERNDFRLLHFGFACEHLVKRRWEARTVTKNYKDLWSPKDAARKVRGVVGNVKFVHEEIPDKWKVV